MIHLIFSKKLKRLICEAFTRGLQAGYQLGLQENLANGMGVILGTGPIEKQVEEILAKEGF